MIRTCTLLAALLSTACATVRPMKAVPPPSRFCAPALPCWPTADEWAQLRTSVGGRLVETPSPYQACVGDEHSAKSADCATALERMKNPYYLQDQPGGTESLGWVGAWTAAPSAYAVAAETPDDIVAAVNFAREHKLRLVVKGTGHDYLGRSNAPDSLLVWTHKMRHVSVDDSFVPQGCPVRSARLPIPAVTLEAGTRWMEAYDEVTVKHHRYVQGGGCTSVGAAGGFLQGGGFGSWSKKYGIAAGGLLEAEVVTASGERVIANACQNADLFWALRGGGGGTFGIVTKVTLMTHPLPSAFGVVVGKLQAKSDAAYQELLRQFVTFYGQHLSDEHWGEKVVLNEDNSFEVSMDFEGFSVDGATAVWAPFSAWVSAHPELVSGKLEVFGLPSEKMWDYDYLKQLPDVVVADQRPGAPANLFWWRGDGDQVATYWAAYQSRWIPQERLQHPSEFAQVLFAASRHWSIELHFNKGQAGAAPEALERDRQTSMNPAVLDAAALAILGASAKGYPGVWGREPDAAKGAEKLAHVSAAMKILRDATPGEGSYVNETDYFEPDWQRAFWGENYPRLLEIKRKFDPDGMFTCHHCVGSE